MSTKEASCEPIASRDAFGRITKYKLWSQNPAVCWLLYLVGIRHIRFSGQSGSCADKETAAKRPVGRCMYLGTYVYQT
jgi:hypothetical protein